jgi:plastocyanin
MKSRSIVVTLCLLTLAGSFFVLRATPEPVGAGVTVSISNFQFGPKVVRIKEGSEVTWQVKEGTHTVNADDGSFESPTLSAGQEFSHTFSKAGTYRYYCSFHGSKGGHDMSGTVIVTK